MLRIKLLYARLNYERTDGCSYGHPKDQAPLAPKQTSKRKKQITVKKNSNRFEHHRAPTNISNLKRKCAQFPTKARYRSHEEAIDVLHRLQNAGRTQLEVFGTTRREEKRAFACKTCKGWHLTHEDQRTPGNQGRQVDYRKAA